MVKQANDADGAVNDATVSSLANMAESMARLASTQAPEQVATSVAAVRNIVNDMATQLQGTRDTEASQMQNTTLFTQCFTTLGDCFTTSETGGSTPSSGSDPYAVCLTELAVLKTALDTCRATENTTHAGWKAACDLFDAVDRNFGGEWTGDKLNYPDFACTDTFDGTYRAYLQRHIDWLVDYRAKKAACIPSPYNASCVPEQTAYDAKVVECEGLKPVVPAKCTEWVGKRQCCSQHDTCYSAASTAHSSVISTGTTLIASLKVQWRALQRIICLLDVIVLAGDQTTALNACIAKTHDASAFDVVPATSPAKDARCPYPDDATCKDYEVTR